MNKYKYIICVILFLVIASQTAFSNNVDSLLIISSEKNSLSHLPVNFLSLNPIFKHIDTRPFNTSLFLGTNLRGMKKPVVYTHGQDLKSINLAVNSRKKLKSLNVWGNADYKRSNINNIKWNAVSDRGFIYPYSIAHTSPVKNYLERYQFNGGFGKTIKSIDIALEGKYIAQYEYGKNDPRSLNKLYDIEIKTGIAKRILNSKLAISLRYNNYRQRVNLRSVTEDRTDMIFLLKGFGQQHEKLSERTASYAVSYKASIINIGVQHIPTKTEGIYWSFNYQSKSLEQNHRNKLTPFLLKQTNINSILGYKRTLNKGLLYSFFDFEYTQKTGTEVTFNLVAVHKDPILYDWKKLSEAQRYSFKRYTSAINIQYEYIFSKQKTMCTHLRSEFTNNNESFVGPVLYTKYNQLNNSLHINYTQIFNHYMLSIYSNVAVVNTVSKNNKWLKNTDTEKAYTHDQDYFAADKYRFKIGITNTFPVSDQLLMFVDTNFKYEHNNIEPIKWANIRVGIIF